MGVGAVVSGSTLSVAVPLAPRSDSDAEYQTGARDGQPVLSVANPMVSP
jgi:hypothetical protein